MPDLSKSMGPVSLQILWQALHMAEQIDQASVTVIVTSGLRELSGPGVESKVGNGKLELELT